MMLPHEIPATGVPAAVAARFQALVPVIETDRQRLRAPQIEDFQAYAGILDGPGGQFILSENTRTMAWFDFVQTVATWMLRGFGSWAAEPKDGSEVLGFVLIGFESSDREPELGYLFTEVGRGTGFATEAARAARNHAYATLGLTTRVNTIDPHNAPSIGLAERLGATRDPALEAEFGDGRLCYRNPRPEAC